MGRDTKGDVQLSSKGWGARRGVRRCGTCVMYNVLERRKTTCVPSVCVLMRPLSYINSLKFWASGASGQLSPYPISARPVTSIRASETDKVRRRIHDFQTFPVKRVLKRPNQQSTSPSFLLIKQVGPKPGVRNAKKQPQCMLHWRRSLRRCRLEDPR